MYYSVKDVAKILKCDPETIRRRIRTGKLESVVIGGKHKIKESEIKELCKEYIKGIDISDMSLEEISSLV